jgi:hypothetical protein
MRTSMARVTVLLLAAVLLASPVFAASPRAALKEPGLFASFWQLVEWIVPSLGKGGITIDPNGAPAPDEGRSTIDPDGLTLPEDNEGRVTIDPNG